MDASQRIARRHVDYEALPDAELAAHIVARHGDAFRVLMTRCNQRLFRVARGMLRSDHEAEDVVQESYVIAFEKLGGFRGESSLLTWLTRIVINEARQRVRNRKETVEVGELERATDKIIPFPARYGSDDPVAGAARAELRHLLEAAIDALPAPFRVVYMMRELEECSVEETATNLGLRPETVKTRLHRARRLLRSSLEHRVTASLKDAFQFLGMRCARITNAVIERLHLQ